MSALYYNETWLNENKKIEDWVLKSSQHGEWWINKITYYENGIEALVLVNKNRNAATFKEIYFIRSEVYNEEKPKYIPKEEVYMNDPEMKMEL